MARIEDCLLIHSLEGNDIGLILCLAEYQK